MHVWELRFRGRPSLNDEEDGGDVMLMLMLMVALRL
jgi:hypothetical protein